MGPSSLDKPESLEYNAILSARSAIARGILLFLLPKRFSFFADFVWRLKPDSRHFTSCFCSSYSATRCFESPNFCTKWPKSSRICKHYEATFNRSSNFCKK